MAFVIMKGNLFVAESGHASSYTNDLCSARKFETREEAERNVCPENENIKDFNRLLDEYRR